MNHSLRRVLSLILCVVMVLGITGVSVFAEDTAAAEESAATEDSGKQRSDVSSVFNSDMYVLPSEEAGLTGRINVDLDAGGSTGTFYVPGGVDVSLLKFRWDDSGLKVSQSGTVYASGEAPVPMPGEKLTYKIKKKAALCYLTVKTVQGSAGVQPMYLDIDESRGTIDAMNDDDDHETYCYGSMEFNGKEAYMSIKGRGNSTWSMPKKPYNMKLFEDEACTEKDKKKLIDGQEKKTHKYTLLANYFDNSLIRNKIAYDLAKDLGIGLDSQFVDLWMNGEYLGNYILCQKKDWKNYDNGFVIENDHIPDADEMQFAFPKMHNMPLKHNMINVDDIGDDAVAAGVDQAWIEQWFGEKWDYVLDYDSEEYQKYFDLDSWAKMFLMFEVSKTYDCYAGNILMYVQDLDEDKLYAGPAWDYDIAFGRTLHKFFVGVSEPIQVNAEGWYNDSIGYLVTGDVPVTMLQEFGKHASFMQHVAKIYTEYKWAFDKVVDNVSTQAEIVRDSALMDRDKMSINLAAEWVVAPITMSLLGTGKYKLFYHITTGWDDHIYNLREYCSKRIMWLTDHLYVEKPEGEILSKETETGATELLASVTKGTYQNTFQWQFSENGEDWTDLEGATAQTLTPAAAGQYRCVVTNVGPVITTYHGGSVDNNEQVTLTAVSVENVAPAEETADEADAPAETAEEVSAA